MKPTFTLLMLTRDSTMKETHIDEFCKSDRADRIENIANAMRKEFVSDFKIVTKQGKYVHEGAILQSKKVNQCPKCLRHWTYNEIQEAREQGKYGNEMIGNLDCGCGCTFLVDWKFSGKPVEVYRWSPEETKTEEPTMVSVATFPNGFQKQAQDYHLSLRHCNLNPGFKWEGGDLHVLLPEAEVSCLRMMQEANPARFGNTPEVNSSLEEARRLNCADYTVAPDRERSNQ